MLNVHKVIPPPVGKTVTIEGLTEEEYRALLACLKHCSGGHIASYYYANGASIPGNLYNMLVSKLDERV